MIRDPRHENHDSNEDEEAPSPQVTPREDDDLDLDLEEVGDSDRLKEGFTGQER